MHSRASVDALKERRISYLCPDLNPGYSNLTLSHYTDRATTSAFAKHVIGMCGRHKSSSDNLQRRNLLADRHIRRVLL